MGLFNRLRMYSTARVRYWALLAIPLCLLLILERNFWGFIQDDAFISFRYARNLVDGEGLVFNPGERVEGYSNLLWTLLMALPIGLGLDPVPFSTGLGLLCSLGALALCHALSRLVLPDRGMAVQLLPSLFLATSTSFSLWSVSGMELPLFLLLMLAGSYFLLRDLGEAPSDPRRMALSGLLLGLASLTRPEGPLFVFLAFGAILLCGRGRDGFLRRMTVFALAAAGLLLPFYAWRLAYYGHLVPNTYFVKAAGGMYAIEHGVAYLKGLLLFNHNGVLMGLALIGLFGGKDVRLKAFAFAVVLAYTAYMVKIGGDILPMYRLYVPCLPFLYLLAAAGAANVVGLVAAAATRLKIGIWRASSETVQQIKGGAIWSMVVAVLFIVVSDLRTGLRHSEYGGVLEALENCHIAAAHLLNEEHEPGDIVLGQDMGAIPYHAEDLRFVDVIGLTERRIAREMYDAAYTPYLRYLMWTDPEDRQRIEGMDKRVKEYLLSLDARFILFNVYMPQSDRENVLAAIQTRDESVFQPFVSANTFYHGLGGDARFAADYRLRAGWAYSHVYYILLYERMGSASSTGLSNQAVDSDLS